MASYKFGKDPTARPRDDSRSKRYGTYVPEPSKSKRSSWSLGGGFAEQAEALAYNAPVARDPQVARPVYPRRDDSLSKAPTSSHFGFHRTPKQPPTREASPAKGKHTRNVLRRKPSSIAQHASSASSPRPYLGSESSPPPAWSNGALSQYGTIPDSMNSMMVEIGHENDTTSSAQTNNPRIIPELDRYRNHAVPSRTSKEKLASEIPHKIYTQNLPSPGPLYSGQSSQSRYSGYSASPSTQFSESSGPASYSRNTTPTSMSSQSPGIMIPVKNSTRMVHSSPSRTRPPVTRRRTENDPDPSIIEPQGLPSVRESLTSSSSSSTVKDNEKGKEKKKKKRLSPPPPSPPPRKSSQKFRRPAYNEQNSASGPTILPVLGAGEDLVALQYAVDAHMQGRSRTAPPMRPSRQGTPDLSAQMAQLGESMAFIHSNLFGHANSGESGGNFIPAPLSRSEASTPLNIDQNTRPVFHSRLPSRGYSPNPMTQKSRETATTPSGLGIVPDLRPQEDPHPGQRMRTPSPSTRRFGLFGRRTATEPTPTVPEKKPPRRGPQAGTGHEGYGKYAIRGRSTSSTALATGRDQISSVARPARDSISGKVTQDPFFLQRMSPVIIAGGGEIIENLNASPELTRTESSTSLAGLPRPSLEYRAGFARPSPTHQTSSSVGKEETSRTTLWPSALPRNSGSISSSAYPFPSMAKESKIRRPSDSSENEAKPTLAVRRSMQRLHSFDQEPLKLPRPINVMGRGPSPAISSHDASVTSLLSFDDTPAENIGLRRVAKSKVIEKPPKRSRSPRKQKWNFFQRAQAGKPELEIPVPVVAEPTPKAVAHYAMMAMDEQEALENAIGLDDIMREVAEAESTQVPLDSFDFGSYSRNLRRQEQIHQPVLNKYESPLDLRADIEKTRAQLEPQETALMKAANVTRPRLQQVGRIPQIHTTRPQQMSPKSFSRPFARASMIQYSEEPAVNKEFIAVGIEIPSTAEPVFVTETGEEIRASIGEPSSSEESGEQLKEAQKLEQEQEDFLRFSQRKDSVVTTSSSSFSGLLNTTENITAVIPDSQDPLEEDEVWDEYDDLVGGNAVHARVSTTSSHGVPFMYENYESSRSMSKEKETVPLMIDNSIQTREEPRKSSASSEFNPESFISGYRDRNNSVSTEVEKKHRSSTSSRPRRNSGPPPLSMHRKSASLSSHSRHSSDTKLVTITEKSSQLSHLAQVNLRFGSIRISKWLTFGQVLFSPIRETIVNPTTGPNTSKPLNILVIDGLGNDDWSFYAAETYPKVTFYNLSGSPSLSSNPRRDSPFLPATPENHRQIQHLSLAERFPFPGNMFSACVLRFPPASSEAIYKNLIAEARRVLKPGGWLECNVLDLEMANMGNRARRAVRGLKLKMQAADPAVHLQSSAEMLEWLVAKKGFTERKSCRVGIPVASIVASTSTSPSKSTTNPEFPAIVPENRGASQVAEEEKSLADLMRDTSPSSDAGIAKMVARVGRWWYTRCYESLVLPRNGEIREDESIWDDKALLDECAKWNTSFTLLVGYARKPIAGNWRTRGSSL